MSCVQENIIKELQHRRIVQLKRVKQLSETAFTSEPTESLPISESHRVKEVHGLLKDILDAQVEKLKLEQRIKEVTLEKQRQNLCTKLAGLQLKKNEDLPTRLEMWHRELNVVKKKGQQSIKLKKGTEPCCVKVPQVCYSKTLSSEKDPGKETLEVCIDCNGCQVNLQVYIVGQMDEGDLMSETSTEPIADVQNSEQICVFSDIHVEGLENCVTSHICRGSSLHSELLVDVVNVIYDNYLATFNG